MDRGVDIGDYVPDKKHLLLIGSINLGLRVRGFGVTFCGYLHCCLLLPRLQRRRRRWAGGG
ncbi:hypothetical protein CPC08DRAFT_710381 [Agrocybe pediades]|nr:hypothetical protein CPC08DRAFT_710381 [Agrocybe pediades]